MLIIFFGNIGVGKTTLAEAFARMHNFDFICFDKMVFESLNKDEIYSKNDEFLLSPQEIAKVYSNMHTRAGSFITQGQTVVLESMYFKKQREDAKQVAKRLNIPYVVVEIVCEEEEIKRRLEERKQVNPQSGGFKLYLKYKKFLEDENEPHITINTTGNGLFENLKLLESRLNLD